MDVTASLSRCSLRCHTAAADSSGESSRLLEDLQRELSSIHCELQELLQLLVRVPRRHARLLRNRVDDVEERRRVLARRMHDARCHIAWRLLRKIR